jgi:hypothetical protein
MIPVVMLLIDIAFTTETQSSDRTHGEFQIRYHTFGAFPDGSAVVVESAQSSSPQLKTILSRYDVCVERTNL